MRCVLNSRLAVFCQSSDVYNVSVGFIDPEISSLRDDLVGYLQTVIRVEWPTQAEGRPVDRATAYLERLNRTAIGLKPSSVSGALVLILIIALSNPFGGDFRVSTQPFDQALSQIQAAKVTDR